MQPMLNKNRNATCNNFGVKQPSRQSSMPYNSPSVASNRSLPAPARLSNITTLDGSDLEYVDNYNTLLNKLDAVYHSAIRFFTNAPYTTHHCDLSPSSRWLALASYSSPNPLAPGHLQERPC